MSPVKQPTESNHEHEKKVLKKKNHYIGHLKEATSYSNDNVYIHHGYRINYNTPILIIKSLFHKHNELLNIWTHLIGGAIILGFIYYVYAHYSTVNRAEIREDLDKIFDPQSIGSENSNFDMEQVQDYANNKLGQLIDEFVKLENILFTPCTYSQLLDKFYELKTVFKFKLAEEGKEAIEEYTLIFGQKLQNIKSSIISQIDSASFNWMEIYKYDYIWLEKKIVYEQFYPRIPTDSLRISRWPIFVFLLSAIMCLFGSASFHLFFQMSCSANRYLMRVDYAGISLLILGSTFPPFYYGFYCDPLLRNLYLCIIGIACFSVYVISIFDFIHTEPWRKIKGIMYGSLGIFAGVPAIHLYLREFYKEEINDYLPFQDSFQIYALMGASYLIGLFFYISRIPEKYWPGRFDILGQSHQIWHILVFFGVLFTYIGAIDNLYARRSIPCILK